MTTEYFAPLDDKGFGISGFNYDKFKQWLEGQQLNFRRTLAIQGDLLGNWDGSSPLDLSAIDTDASTGFAADASEGNVQFNGSVFAAGIALFDANNDNTQVGAIGGSNDELLINNVGSKNLRLQTLTGGDIKFQPGSGGKVTLNDGSTDLWTFRVVSGVPTMEWRPADLTNIGFIKMGADNIGGGDIGSISIQAPYDSGQAELTITNAASGDGGSRVSMSSFTKVQVPSGSASNPGLEFGNSSGDGLYRAGSGEVDIALGGSQIYRFGATVMQFLNSEIRVPNGSASDPGLNFIGDTDTGIFSTGSNVFRIAAAGQAVAAFTASITAFRTATTGAAANLNQSSNGSNIERSTSSLKYKDGWQYADKKALAQLTLPTPIVWEDEHAGTMLGYGTEHLYEVLPAIGQDFNEEGEPENYDYRSVMAILHAKIERLENLPMIKAQLGVNI